MLVAGTLLTAAASSAWAGEIFTWRPQAAGLNGGTLTADTVRFADYDLIVQAAGSDAITEAGYLPITGFSLAGQVVAAPGLNDPGGTGWGAYMRITGAATSALLPSGTPGATYDKLSYEIVGFNGLATYGFAADGSVVVGGEVNNPVTLAAGSLISGEVAFVPASAAGPTIEGKVSVTVGQVAPGFATGLPGVLDLTIVHPPGDYSLISPTTTQVAAGSGTTGTFSAAATAVPEPASALLLTAGLLANGALVGRRRLRAAAWRGRKP